LTLFRLRKQPAPAALAVVTEDEFLAKAGAVEAFAAYRDFRAWEQSRAALQMDMTTADARAELVPIDVNDFIAWGRCLHERTSEASLDLYATLVLEFLIQDA
jgi:hypothetical protein